MIRDIPDTMPGAAASGDAGAPPADPRRGTLLLRYARGRTRNFFMRQWLTIGGGIALALLVSPEVGIACIVMALTGEAVDLALLHYVIRKDGNGRAASYVATTGAAFQGLTIAACCAVPHFYAGNNDTEFFVAAFLGAAATNAGLSLNHHGPSAVARLLIYATVFAVFFMDSVSHMIGDGNGYREHGLDLVGMCVMAFVTVGFILFFRSSFLRQQRYQAELLSNQARLEEKERLSRRLALVAEHANDSVIISSPDGHISWVNETFSKITGYSFDEAIGRTPGDLLNHEETDPVVLRRIADAAMARQPLRTEILNRRRDGTAIWMEVSLTPILNVDGSPAMTISVERDITAMKQREAELARARTEAEEAMRAKTQFLASMSHEFRTPMNGVLGMTQLLAQSPLTDEQQLWVDTIHESGEALLAIIHDVLEASRMQTHAPTLHAEPFSPAASLNSVITLLGPLAKTKGIKLIVCPAPAPPRLLGDPGRFRQIVLNLVGNAIKFTDKGGIEVDMSHAVRPDGKVAVCLAVIDTGIGIARASLDKIFDSFTQADGDISRKYGGTGLGLTIARHLAREMGGDITVRSVLGEGSCFTLTMVLPRAAETAARLPPISGLIYGTAAGNAAADPSASHSASHSGNLLGSSPGAASGAASGGINPAPGSKSAGKAPVGGPAPTGGHAPVTPPIRSVALTPGRRVLVVEDNATNRLIVQKMLETPGVELAFAKSGEEATEMWKTFRPDITFMDLAMPGMDGREATRRIRAEETREGWPKRPVVALTANVFEEDRKQCLADGFDDFLTKPVSKRALVDCLDRLLA